MGEDLRGFWKDNSNDTKPKHPKYTKPKPYKPKNKKKRKSKNKVRYDLPRDEFYRSKEWRQLRYMVLKHYGGSCMLCGRTHRHHGVVLHVDHIQPRSRRPDLALKFDNLQVLCEDCNLGKMTGSGDWRPPSAEEVEEMLDSLLLSTSPV